MASEFPTVHPVREYRRKRELSLDAFGARAGVSGATISRIETGEAWGSFEALDGIIRACRGEVTADDLLEWLRKKRKWDQQRPLADAVASTTAEAAA
jgi:transcriptional regulator with XRE-family HTH domain